MLFQVNSLRQELQLLASSKPVTIVTSNAAGSLPLYYQSDEFKMFFLISLTIVYLMVETRGKERKLNKIESKDICFGGL